MIDAITSALGSFLYPMFSIIFLLVDLLQGLFQSFAGIGNMTYGDYLNGKKEVGITAGNSGLETDTGIVYYLMTSDLVKNLLISIAVLGLFLIIIFTAMAFIKNVYAAKPKTWQEIVGSALKGLMNFVFLPVCCLLGVWLGNILLNAIDGATSTGGALNLSRKLFLSSAYNANRVRNLNDGDTLSDLGLGDSRSENNVLALLKVYTGDDSITLTQVLTQDDIDYYANIIDTAFAATNDKNVEYRADSSITVFVSKKGNISIYEWSTVSCFYNLWNINYLLLAAGGIFMMWVMANLTYGMIKRMFVLLMLFVISPALCAMYPLDDGKAVGAWKGDFMKNTINAYGAVAGMNLFFSLAPLIQNINLGDDIFGDIVDAVFLNDIVEIVLLICGLYVVNDFVTMISGYIGAGNALSDGKALRKQTKDYLGKVQKKTQSAAGALSKAAATAYNVKGEKGLGAGAWSLAKSFGGELNKATFGVDPVGFVKASKDAWKSTTKEYKATSDMKLLAKDIEAYLNGGTMSGDNRWGTNIDAMMKYASAWGMDKEAIKVAKVEGYTDIADMKADKDLQKAIADATTQLKAVTAKRNVFASDYNDTLKKLGYDSTIDPKFVENFATSKIEDTADSSLSNEERNARAERNRLRMEIRAIEEEIAGAMKAVSKAMEDGAKGFKNKSLRISAQKNFDLKYGYDTGKVDSSGKNIIDIYSGKDLSENFIKADWSNNKDQLDIMITELKNFTNLNSAGSDDIRTGVKGITRQLEEAIPKNLKSILSELQKSKEDKK